MAKNKLPVQAMTDRQIDNLINKYNKRAESAARILGTKSPLYSQYTTLLSLLTGGNVRTKTITTESGASEKITQGKRGRQSTNTFLTNVAKNPRHQQKIVTRLERSETVREYVAGVKKTHSEERFKGKYVKNLTNNELREYIKTSTNLIRELSSRIDEVYNVIGTNLDDFKNYSIDELQNMVDKINEDYDNPEYFDDPPEPGVNAVEIPY